MKQVALSVCLLLLILLPQCAPAEPQEVQTPSPPVPDSTRTEPDLESESQEFPTATPDRTDRPGLPDRGLPETVGTVEAQPAITGEVPEELLSRIIDDLVERTAAERNQLNIVRSEEAIWNDGGMGCGEPGVVYTQAPTQGYWVVLRFAEQEYDYRVTADGSFFLCDRPWPASSGAPIG